MTKRMDWGLGQNVCLLGQLRYVNAGYVQSVHVHVRTVNACAWYTVSAVLCEPPSH